ncbi:MAG: GNAT family N-acetyltransferase [Myxococcales bacterium]|nr:GNAT family N-acetyltransferase [Myxococcales bacterium]
MPRATSPLSLETERLHMDLPGSDAAPRMVDYYERNRAHLTPWEPPFARPIFTQTFWQQRLSQNQDEYVTGQSLRLVLRRREAPRGPVVGLANFTQFVRGASMSCTLGYSLDHEAEGKGLMTEALRAATTHVFQHFALHRIMAHYIPTNQRSGAVLRRVGFVVEGYAREFVYIDGAWCDHILTSLLNSTPVTPDYLTTPRRRI